MKIVNLLFIVLMLGITGIAQKNSVKDAKAYERFVGANFAFAAQVSAVALKAGVSADAEYRDGMVVFTMAIGELMYEASVGGQKFKVEMY